MSQQLTVHGSTSTMATLSPAAAPAAGTPAAVLQGAAALVASVQEFLSGVEGTFGQMDVAEEEIAAAQARHPQAADRIYHSFLLVKPTQDRMETDFVYRSHCRELLDRVAAGEDTRPGTAAEACCALLTTSMLAPLRSSATGLYQRMWAAARFPDIEGFAEDLEHHEALEKTVIDEHEQFIRRKLAVADRRLVDITCEGRHHGETVACAYARPEQLQLGA